MKIFRPRRNEVRPKDTFSKYPTLIADLLWSRGIDSIENAEEFLNPKLSNLQSPFRLLNLEASVERLIHALENNERVAIYADYDMDGTSGLALLYTFLKARGFKNVIPTQPDRFEEGYGVHPFLIEKLASENAKVIVTIDTGISAFEAAIRASQLGIDLIITDHHTPSSSELPQTEFIVNPNQPADQSKLNYLSGAGVAFFLCLALRQRLREKNVIQAEKQPDLRQWLDYFVLGTVSDVVDLHGENRILVHHGLKQLAQSKRAGIQSLLKLCANKAELTAQDVGFLIAPKLNAASRLGFAHLTRELLLTEDFAQAAALSAELMQLNDKRRTIQEEVFQDAKLQANLQVNENPDQSAVIVFGPWHEGVIGVVAAKLAEEFKRPAIVLSHRQEHKNYRGSVRSYQGISALEILKTCKDLLDRFGGHPAAAGLQVSEENVLAFVNQIKNLRDLGTQHIEIFYDLDFNANTKVDEIMHLSKLGPFGKGNPEPVFYIKQLKLNNVKILKEKHVKGTYQNWDLIAFNAASNLDSLSNGSEALVQMELNEFRGNIKRQLKLVDNLTP